LTHSHSRTDYLSHDPSPHRRRFRCRQRHLWTTRPHERIRWNGSHDLFRIFRRDFLPPRFRIRHCRLRHCETKDRELISRRECDVGSCSLDDSGGDGIIRSFWLLLRSESISLSVFRSTRLSRLRMTVRSLRHSKTTSWTRSFREESTCTRRRVRFEITRRRSRSPQTRQGLPRTKHSTRRCSPRLHRTRARQRRYPSQFCSRNRLRG